MNEPIAATSITFMPDGSRVVLSISTADGETYLFTVPEPAITLDSLRNAESTARSNEWASK